MKKKVFEILEPEDRVLLELICIHLKGSEEFKEWVRHLNTVCYSIKPNWREIRGTFKKLKEIVTIKEMG